MTPAEIFRGLERACGIAALPMPAFDGADPILPTPFRAASAAAAALGLGAACACEIAGCAGQAVSVALPAAAASLLSFSILRLGGRALPRPSETNPAVSFYRCGDGRWIYIHGGFPHLERGLLDLLGAENTREALSAAIAKWNAFELEDEIAARGLCGAVARTAVEWRASPQGAALRDTPAIRLTRIGDAPPVKAMKADAPLAGIRVLDLTRVLAGPTAGRTLASYGADVLSIRAPHLPTFDVFDVDTGSGKRSAYLDLRDGKDLRRLRALLGDAHVFVDSYRPGALAGYGLSPDALAQIRPGIVHVAVSCYGHDGPWAARGGWEQLGQTATGLALAQGAFLRAGEPRLIPAAACDYITGYLAAAGALAALLRRRREGGSWRVEVSLCATAMWLQSCGRVDAASVPRSWDPLAGSGEYRQSCMTGRGRLDCLGPVVRMSQTPPAWTCPPPAPGADEPVWRQP